MGMRPKEHLRPGRPSRSRDADAAATVGAGAEGDLAAGDGCGGAAAGAAGRALGVPGVAGDAEEEALGDGGVAELRRGGLAHGDGAGVLQALDLDGVAFRKVVAEGPRGVGGGEAGEVLELLDAEGEAGERAGVVAAGDAVAHFARFGEEFVTVAHAAPGVEDFVGLVDAVEAGLHEFDGGELLRADAGGEFVGGRKAEVRRHLFLLQ